MNDPSENRSPSHAIFGLNQPESAKPGASEPASPPPTSSQPIYVQTPAPPAPWSFSGGQILFLLVLLLLVISGVNLYLVITTRQETKQMLAKHSDQLALLTRRMDSSDDHYAQLSARFQVTSERLGMTRQELNRAKALAQQIQTQQKAAVNELSQAIAQKASTQQVNKLQADANAKFGGLSTDIAGNRKDLEATKQALVGTKGELTGAIARTHEELVALAHRTDRDYFEFKLARKGARQKVGSVMIELSKTNRKKNLYTINLFFDDKRTVRKDNSIDQPLFFYVEGASSALELVVNRLGKNYIAGYLSTPKGFFPKTPSVLTHRPGL